MLRLASSWVWDNWVVDDGERYHLFYLKASRSLRDPDRRHQRAAIGHAVSDDLRAWEELPDALVHDDPPAPDDQATWTGCTVRADDGSWRLFYTGCSRAEAGLVQRVLCARSEDLVVWERTPLVVEADPRWYELLDPAAWHDQAWRDPWVFRDGDGWHLLVTARGRQGDPAERGVIGHAVSSDLESWTVRPPLSGPGGFGQLEVPSVQVVEGRPVLLFSCLRTEMAPGREGVGGIWAVPAASLLGPYDVAAATVLHDPRRYAGHLVRERSGRWVLLAFDHMDDDGRFVGTVADPVPVAWEGDRLVLRPGG